jgi:predicted transcriptional regulator
MKTPCIALALAISFSVGALAEPKVGSSLPAVKLSGDCGGLVTGQAWSSDTMKGKPRVVFYVDPDEKDLNEHVGEAIQAAKLAKESYGSVAIINMKASWLPNFAIAKSLAAKQKKYPRTVYVKDLDKSLVKRWDVADDGYDVIVLDADGVVRFYGSGKLDSANTKRVVSELVKAISEFEARPRPAE